MIPKCQRTQGVWIWATIYGPWKVLEVLVNSSFGKPEFCMAITSSLLIAIENINKASWSMQIVDDKNGLAPCKCKLRVKSFASMKFRGPYGLALRVCEGKVNTFDWGFVFWMFFKPKGGHDLLNPSKSIMKRVIFLLTLVW